MPDVVLERFYSEEHGQFFERVRCPVATRMTQSRIVPRMTAFSDNRGLTTWSAAAPPA